MLAWKWLGVGLIWFQLESNAQLKTPVSKKPFYAFVIPSVAKANPEKDTVLKEEGFWIYGVVKDEETREPVPFAIIQVDATCKTVSDIDGKYRIFIPVAMKKYGPKILIKASSIWYFANQSTLWISELGTSSEMEFNPFVKPKQETQLLTVGMLVSSDFSFEDRRPASRGLFHITKIVKPKVKKVKSSQVSQSRKSNVFSRFFRFLLGG
jgi:hypothetical protein